MKTTEYDGATERMVLAGMVMDDVVCLTLSGVFKKGMFDNSWANEIATWCQQWAEHHKAAPKEAIDLRFAKWAETTTVKDDVKESVREFVGYTLNEHTALDSNAVTAAGIELFNQVVMSRELELAQVELQRGLVDDAQQRLDQLYPISLGGADYCDLTTSYEPWVEAFSEDETKPLIQYPGDCGLFFADAFKRGELYSFMAPDKTGKSTYLIDATVRAIKQGRRVVFFDTGDSSRNEVIVRLAKRITCKPDNFQNYRRDPRWDDGPGEMVSDTIQTKPVSPQEAWQIVSRYSKKQSRLRIFNDPADTVTVDEIESRLITFERDGWIPDVIVIDYADILLMKGSDSNEQIDRTWKSLRALTQSRNVLGLTATQSNAAAYSKRGDAILTRQNFSGRKTKLAHVNGMIGINVTDDERSNHFARLNWVVRRRMRNREKKVVRIAGCYDSESPIIVSKW